jgi:ribonuclease E
MAKRMLIDATHPEETRVVVISGNRLEEFDFESSTKKQVKGNIYLAKVTRVEPSLQAAFVEYGGNRHGFLAFSEIHSDYYRIPVGDREPGDEWAGPESLDAADQVPAGASEAVEEPGVPLEAALPEMVAIREVPENGGESASARDQERGFENAGEGERAERTAAPQIADDEPAGSPAGAPSWLPADSRSDTFVLPAPDEPDTGLPIWHDGVADEPVPVASEDAPAASGPVSASRPAASSEAADGGETDERHEDVGKAAVWENTPTAPADAPAAETQPGNEAEPVETIGGDDFDEAQRQRSRVFRHYKIQEVIKRRQIMLVQVTKEERGTKGAALTTYLSLAGRYCVLMPNTARGGGVSRKITSISDRRRLKEILEELDIPEGMGVIVRTAGAERSKAEIRRDYEYLLRLWNEIRDLTLRSTAPALIYEEGNLIKRSIRDLYTRDIDDVVVEGEEGYRTAKAFMKMLMPSHAKRVQPYRESQIGLFHRFQVEGQIDAIHAPSVQLRSGGYIVINQTEALVAIDVNSGRSTRERNIEETALRTNLEAAEEIARQLRLRDLAGLIVIDFIDMEEHRNQAAVERRLKETLKNDRARIQVGRISPFGLLEMSRQRLRPSLAEVSTQPCPHCGGSGFIRSTESTALYVLRSIEEEGMRRRAAEISVYVPTTVALYILNQKRASLTQLETRYAFQVSVARDDALIPPAFRMERLRAFEPAEASAPAPLTQAIIDEERDETEEADADAADAAEIDALDQDEAGDDRRRRSRRRRRRRRDGESPGEPADEAEAEIAQAAVGAPGRGDSVGGEDGEGDRHRRRRGRRGGGRRRVRHPVGTEAGFGDLPAAAETVEILPTPPAAAEELAAEAIENDVPAAWTAAASEEGAVPDAVGLETASLPALSGDWSAAESAALGAAAGGEDGSSQPPSGQTLPFEPPAAEAIEIVESTPAEGHAAPAEAEPPAPPAVVFNGSEQSEAISATADAETPEPAPTPVQTVTAKPANPRRGWWQRLIQP